MKIALATPLYPPESGGPATYAKLLAEHMGEDLELVKFSSVRHLPKVVRHFRYLWLVLGAAARAEVVYALDPVSTGLPALLAARILGKPFVVKIVGDFAWEQGRQRFGITASLDEFVVRKRLPFQVAILRFVERWVATRARQVVVPSEYLKGIVMTWGVPAERISVIYNSIEVPTAASDLPSERVPGRVLAVGRLVPWKGLRELIEAVATVRESDVPALRAATLTIVGDGPDEAVLKDTGTRLLGDAISLPGRLSNSDALDEMRRTDILVLNSSYEGLSHLLIEALSLGCAIIASNAGGNPELIQHEKNGILVPVGDTPALAAAISQLLSDPSYAAQLREGALSSARRFSVARMITDTQAVLTTP
jgi:glycosyltransferase involved in cell wall biosynthesis